MNYTVPGYLLPYVIGGSVAIVAALLFGLHNALERARWTVRERRQAVTGVAVVLVAWFFVTLTLTWLGFYRGALSRTPTIQYGVLIPIIAGFVIFRGSRMLRRVIEAVPQEWIVGVQVYRALGAIFLVLYAAGRMPGLFAWPAGVGDVIVGLLAPVVGIAYARRPRSAAGLLRTWNLLGIGDLMVALATGFLTSPSPLGILAFDTPNVLITAFPLAMIPVFLVPLSILLHLASLKKLRSAQRAQASPILEASLSS
jgi:hypothetical protein